MTKFYFILLTFCFCMLIGYEGRHHRRRSLAKITPRLRTRITSKGFHYVQQLAQRILTHKLASCYSLAYAYGSRSDQFSAALWNAQFETFESPVYKVDLDDRSNKIGLVSTGGSLRLSSNWKVHINFDMFGTEGTGTMNAVVRGINVMAKAQINTTNAKPYILASTIECSVNVAEMEANFDGGMMGYLANSVSSSLTPVVKEFLSNAVCSQVIGPQIAKLNGYLSLLETEVELSRNHNFRLLQDGNTSRQGLIMDYGLVENPIIGANHIDLVQVGLPYFKGMPRVYDTYPNLVTAPKSTDRMLMTYLSDDMFNKVIAFVRKGPMSDGKIPSHLFSKFTRDQLTFGCIDCVARMFKKLKDPTEGLSMDMELIVPDECVAHQLPCAASPTCFGIGCRTGKSTPFIQFSHKRARLSADFIVTFNHTKDIADPDWKVLAKFHVKTVGDLTNFTVTEQGRDPSQKKSVLSASLWISSFKTSVIEKHTRLEYVGTIMSSVRSELQKIINMVLQNYVLPVPPLLRLKNSVVNIEKHTLIIGSDFRYYDPVLQIEF